MRLSRPLSVLVLMGAMVAGAAWYAPPQRESAQVAVMLSGATYKLLALKGEAEAGADRSPRTVAQVIDSLARQ